MEKLTKAQEKLQSALFDKDAGKYDGFISSKKEEYPDKNYRGKWLHINECGNCTLYYRNSKGKDREITSCV